jgi:hypothetical protein
MRIVVLFALLSGPRSEEKHSELRVDEDDLKPTGLKDLKHRDPVDARGFHRHVGDAAACQSPVNVAKARTGVASRSGGTATKCSADPQSIPAALGCRRSSAAGEVRGFGADGDDGVSSEAPLDWQQPPGTADEWQSPKRDHVA